MFTGIVIEQGVVAEPPPRLRLRAPGVAADAAIGDSVAVDGCCLTITEIDGVVLAFDAVPETLRRTTWGACSRATRSTSSRPARRRPHGRPPGAGPRRRGRVAA
jgi:riboflavin synthase